MSFWWDSPYNQGKGNFLKGFLMKKIILFGALFLLLLIGFLGLKHIDPKLTLLRDVKGWIFADRINQMFKENQVLIDRVLAICENTDGENKPVDKPDQIPLDGQLWIANYWNIVFDEKSDSFKIDDAWKKKIMDQLKSTMSDYRELAIKYKSFIDQRSQPGSGVNEKLVGYTLAELWGEVFWTLGSSLASDLNDYRRKKKVLVMQTIAGYFPYGQLDEFLKDRILLAAIESGEFQKHGAQVQ